MCALLLVRGRAQLPLSQACLVTGLGALLRRVMSFAGREFDCFYDPCESGSQLPQKKYVCVCTYAGMYVCMYVGMYV